MKKFILLALFILIHVSFGIAQHFTPCYIGNPNNPMNFYIGSATINGINMVAGDEIGIFDGSYCVGAAVLSGPITFYLSMVASQDNTDPGIDGFVAGHSVSIKFWDVSRGSEITDISGVGTTTFEPNGSAWLSLSATVPCTGPSAPTIGTITQPTCAVSTGSVVLNGLPSSGSWTINPGGIAGSGTSTTVSNLAPGTHNFTVTDGEGCTSDPSNDVVINPQPVIPSQPGAIFGNTSVCQGSSEVYSVSLVSGATSYNWSLPGTWSGTPTSNYITATVGSSEGTVSVTASNLCGTSSPSSLSVSVNTSPGQPGSISGETSVCQGSSQTYSVSPVSEATYYTWSLPSGWSGSSTSNSITATAGSSGIISVTANNSCGSSPARTLTVSVTVIPAQPGSISGETSVCQGSSQTYSVSSVSGATYYTWSLPGTWTGSSTSNSITVTVGSNGGTISVTASNSCSTSSARTLSVSVPVTPAQPGAISGNTSVCQGSSEVYSVSLVSGATSYNWSLPGFWSGSSSSASITATVGSSGGTVSVTASNLCGTSSPSSLSVSVNTAPGQPGSISGETSVCQGSSQTYSVSPVSEATYYTWSLPSGWSGSSTSNSITATAGSSGTISVTANNSCGSSPARTLNVSVTAIPAQPGTISGETSVCQGISETYSISPVSGATYYNWFLPSGWIGSSSSNSITATMGSSGGTISVTASNSCGTSSPSSLSVLVNSTPAQPGLISGETSVCQGSSQTYSVSTVFGASYYNWYLPSDWSGSSTSNSITATTGSSGTISVAAGNLCGISSPSLLNVFVSEIPDAPTVGTITQPTCTFGIGSVVLSGLPASGTWTLTRWPGGSTTTGTGTSTTISGLNPGTYIFTVTSASGCTSVASNDVVINSQPETPSSPVVGTITQPTCYVATGSVVLSDLPASGTWILTRSPGGSTTTGTGTSTTISWLNPGTYTFTVTNASGCTSEASSPIAINANPETPSAPIVGAITQPMVAGETGSVELSGLPASGTWTLTRNPGGSTLSDTGTSILVSGIVPGTYAFTVTSASGCISVPSDEVFINAVPVITDQNDITVLEDDSITITVDHLIINDPDNTPSELIINVGSGSNYIVSGSTVIPLSNYFGMLTVPITVNDGIATSSIFDAEVSVTSVNDAPVIDSIPDQIITSDSCFASISLNDYVSDVETADTDLVWSFTGNSALIVEIINQVATITVPDKEWLGSDTIIFIVTDDDLINPLSDSDTVIFTVIRLNMPPEVEDIPDQTIDMGDSFDPVNLDDFVEDDFTPDDDIAWDYDGNVDLTVIIINRVVIFEAPDKEWYGQETITLTATDDEITPLSNSDNVVLTVNYVSKVVENYTDENIHIFPNPSSDIVFIVFDSKINSEINIEVTNVLGQVILVEKKESNRNSVELNVCDLARGTYIIKIVSTISAYSSTFIKE